MELKLSPSQAESVLDALVNYLADQGQARAEIMAMNPKDHELFEPEVAQHLRQVYNAARILDKSLGTARCPAWLLANCIGA